MDAANIFAIAPGVLITAIDARLSLAGRITGTVTDEGGKPLQNIFVRATSYGNAAGQRFGSSVTDANGNYVVSRLEAGDYHVQFMDNDWPWRYIWEYYSDALEEGQAMTVTVLSGTTTGPVNGQLALSAHITGTVTDVSGNPLAGVNVSALGSPAYGLEHWCTTDSLGNYDLSGFGAGVFRVYFSDPRQQHVPEYYDDQPDLVNATPITVASSETRGGVNAQLELAGHIKGIVLNEAGNPAACTQVEALRNDGDEWRTVGSGSVDATGKYDIGGVPAGLYRIRFSIIPYLSCEIPYATEYFNNQSTLEDAEVLAVGVGEFVMGIDAVLTVQGSVSGHVYQADGVTPLANAWVHAMDGDFEFVAGANSDTGGGYRISLPTGTYYLAVESPGYGGVYYGGYDDPHATPVTVTAPNGTPRVDFRLEPEATISGHVHASDGTAPLVGITVDIWPKDGGQIRRAVTDGGGAYTAHGLSSGLYVAKAYANGYIDQFYAGATSWDTATPITVLQPATTSAIDFSLLHVGEIFGLTASNSGPTPLGFSTVFTAAAVDGNPYTYTWDFGDGTRAEGASVSHIYGHTGVFTATVTAHTSNSSQQAIVVVEVVDVPIAGLSASATTPIIVGSNTYFTASLSSGTNVAYVWNFGDGVVADGAEQVHTYNISGTYVAVVTATNSVSASSASVVVAVGTQSAVVEPALESIVTIDGPSGVSTIHIPPQAVSTTTELLYTEVTAPATSPSGYVFAGKAFALDAYQDGAAQESFTFAKAITLTLEYSDADVAGLDEATLTLEYWAGTEWEDASCGAIMRNMVENWLSIPICHLSSFVLYGRPSQVQGQFVYLPLLQVSR